MNLLPKTQSKAPTLSMTSMLDVIFLLLFYFAAMSVQSQWENDMKITLPQAKTAETPERLPSEVVLNIHKDGTIVVNNMTLTLEDLSSRLKKIAEIYPDQAVVIRGDCEVNYETLTKVIDTCRGAGVYNFSLATVAGSDESMEASQL